MVDDELRKAAAENRSVNGELIGEKLGQATPDEVLIDLIHLSQVFYHAGGLKGLKAGPNNSFIKLIAEQSRKLGYTRIFYTLPEGKIVDYYSLAK